MSEEHEVGDFSPIPLMLLEGETPSTGNINQWRHFVKRKSRVDSHRTIDAIFDCAILGSEKATDLKKEADRLLALKLKALIESLDN